MDKFIKAQLEEIDLSSQRMAKEAHDIIIEFCCGNLLLRLSTAKRQPRNRGCFFINLRSYVPFLI